MKQFIIIVSCFIAFVFSSCEKEKITGTGPVVTQMRDVSNFNSVSVSISGTVQYKIDPVYKVEIQAQQNILDVLQTNKVGSELIIKFRDGVRVKDHEQIIVTISAPTLEMATVNGIGEFNLLNELAAANLELRISGSGNINIHEVNLSDKLSVSISGSGNVTVSNGQVKNEGLKISGSGKIDLTTLAAENVTADISGSGDMYVKASQHIDATISGSGSVFYRGNPIISTHISGSGQVRPF